MRILNPPTVYVVESVLSDPLSERRLRRVMERVRCDDFRDVTEAELEGIAQENGWRGSRRKSGRERHGDPPLVFDTYRIGYEPEAGRPGPLVPEWHRRDRDRIAGRDRVVCQTGYGFHSGRGCLFKCDYCMFEDVLVLTLDHERLLERLDPVVKRVEGPTLWKWDNQTDTLCFEPEMGAAKLFIEYFAQFDDKFLMTYSKSDNVDHMLELDHRGQTICCWTLNARTQSRVIERDSAPMEARIEAARKCQRAGYPVRFRLSAVCPVHGWQAEYREMLDLLFAAANPDVISIQTLSRMREPGMFDRVMDASQFEPRFVEAIHAAENDMEGNIWGPLPDAEREEIYRFLLEEIRARSPETPVTLCQEPPHLWKRMADVLEFDPDYYPCCCAKDSVPGGHPAILRRP